MISELCIHDLETGKARVVLAHEGLLEAPNWHPEGFLLVNGEGRLFRVALEAPALVEVSTGRIGGLNNDHGLSPDGRTLAISGKTETGKSCVYVLPVGGGEPVRVTPEVPSWWHGWSPDGGRIAYASMRGDGPVAIRTCALDGSDERLVTDAFDHADGPDYDPEGLIWFNGEREGSVDVWIVRPDGSDLVPMTDGPSVDWFPHPSPDGAHVLFLAYPAGTLAHPAMLEVELRLMPRIGGPSRVVERIAGAHRGGQGTINVPCWAPDSSAFAFMRYRA